MGYWLRRAGLELAKWRFRPKRFGGTVLANAGDDLARYRGVFLFLDEPALINLGDQLFFLPLVRRLAAAGVAVHVQPTARMAFLFRRYPGMPARPGEHLLVSQADLLPTVRARFGPDQPFFLLDTKAMGIDAPVSTYLLRVFNRHFAAGLEERIAAADYLDFDYDRSDPFRLGGHERLVAFSNYVGSGRFRIPRRHDRIFRERLAAETGFVVHLGAEADQAGDRRRYAGLVDLDLRGRTTVPDLYAILGLPNLRRVYCHDTAVLHIANCFEVPIGLLFKRYFRPGENAQKRRAFTSLYEKDLGHVEYLD